MNKIHPSTTMQRTTSLLTGRPRTVVRNYLTIDPKTVARPVGIGAIHVHAAAVKASQARVHATVNVSPDGVVTDADLGTFRPNSLERWVNSILKGEF